VIAGHVKAVSASLPGLLDEGFDGVYVLRGAAAAEQVDVEILPARRRAETECDPPR
jgi:hypothetical protein